MTRILIVDDSALARQRVKQPLEEAGLATVEADGREQALERLDEAPPEAVLLNITLPDGDGACVMDALEERGIDVPVIVSTARDDEEVSRRFLERGASDFLAKGPLYGLRVVNAVRRGLALADPQAPADLPEDEPARVLVLDDSPVIRKLVDKILSEADTPVEVFEAEDAERAIAISRKEDLDVMLIDQNLPGQSGASFLEAQRANGDDTPALGLTGTRDPDTAKRFLDAGAYDVWTKEHESPLRLRVSVERLARMNRIS